MANRIYGKPLVSPRNGAAELYSWTPQSNGKVASRVGAINNTNNVGCSLTEDYNVTYVYDLLFTSNQDKRIPYVVCDYVE